MDPSERHRLLVEALVGPHEREYLTNSYFRAAIERLAFQLPALVNQAADSAEDMFAELQQRIADVAAGPSHPLDLRPRN